MTQAGGDSNARRFLEALFAGKPDELYLLLWTLAGKRSRWFRDVGEAVRCAQSLHGRDLYVGVGLSHSDQGPTRRCVSDQIAGIVGLWADLDLRSDAHQKTALPATIQDALTILPPELPPSFVILTGNGAHAWWLFKEAWVFDTGEDHAAAAKLVARWQSLLRLNAAAHGWAFDRLADLARVLRVPGTTNCKDPKNPKRVEIHSQNDRRYNLGDLTEYLDDHGVPDQEDQERIPSAWKGDLTDKPWSLDPNATLPTEVLDRLMKIPRFKGTWQRQRPDLRDQSQSGYDLALANLGFEAGLTEQQIVDLIIQHRRIHGQQQRTRFDYFQRTIAKTFNRGGRGSPIGSLEARGGPGGPAVANGSNGQPEGSIADPATARALLCEQISNALGVRILRILKITGKEPTYQIELESGRVELPNVGRLVDQRSFRLAIASSANKLIPKIKSKLWDQIAQAMLDALTTADGGEETDFVGSIRMYLEHYLSETPFIDSIESEPIQTRRKPTVYEGHIAVSSSDLQQYINKTFGENRSIKDVASMLTALGASSTRVKGARLRDQSRWLLPVDEFAPADYVPTTKEQSDAVTS